ncbi:MAG: hypothetical protein ABI678_16645 [Kofleriaceae bacterium]
MRPGSEDRHLLGLVWGAIAVAIILALTACNLTLAVESPAPPGRTARVDEVRGFWGLQSYRMEVTAGVAIAMTCAQARPCEHMKVVSDDPAIAEVRPASLSLLKPTELAYVRYHDQQTAAALVVIGKRPGKTTIRVTAEEGHREIAVEVVAAPLTAAR